MMMRQPSFRERQGEAPPVEAPARAKRVEVVERREVLAALDLTHRKIPKWRQRALFLEARDTRTRLRKKIDPAIAIAASEMLAEIALERVALAERTAASPIALGSPMLADAETVLRSLVKSLEALV